MRHQEQFVGLAIEEVPSATPSFDHQTEEAEVVGWIAGTAEIGGWHTEKVEGGRQIDSIPPPHPSSAMDRQQPGGLGWRRLESAVFPLGVDWVYSSVGANEPPRTI